jgi:dipeptidyl aminopeptidase/acylaminoacyl peptidase
VRGSHWGWHPLPQFLASRGYVVLEPEFRGSAGFGERHFRAGWQQWGRAMQDDLEDAVQWAVARGLVDPQRVCIAGGSYGGYAALMGLVRQAQTFRCAAAWVPLADPRWLLREGSPDDWSDEVRSELLPLLLADRQRDSALITQISPVEQAHRIRSPLFLAWGEEDERTPPEQVEALVRALRAHGHRPETVSYPGEGHQWLKTSTRTDFARRLESFLARSLAPAASGSPGASETAAGSSTPAR